ncbi:electron transfer flavoprotein subunit alpha [Geosporobacter ferrireducens]|uniref:electron transfer flavoprotein subunit alpha n=1 Tax=Geosporobacter ferrireducens TaxID=1424294 RepID=UPI00139E4819|nr:electron transfer flavoprotein subunit alpha [Geosporobacter ferrireducens]MTI54871.1 electron transfer flavoprotein subunit alpha [Geosporobacter ferrireducens]
MQELQVDNHRCTLCGKCISACFYDALEMDDRKLLSHDTCTLCGMCIDICPEAALAISKIKMNDMNKAEWNGILVYVEHDQGEIHPITYELIGKALELAKVVCYKVYCLFIGYRIAEKAKILMHYEVEQVFMYDHASFKYYKEDIYTNAFEDCIKNHLKPSIVLIGGTEIGKSLAPSIATRFHTGLTADCTELKIRENSDLVQIRPAFGGNIMAQIITENHRPQFAAVRYKVMSEAEPQLQLRDNLLQCSIEDEKLKSKIEILGVNDLAKTESISDAKILVVVGQGFQRKEDLSLAQELADLLNGKVASSRTLVEKGWMPYEKQIGLSGKTVKPEIIITCGVSGSIQFISGMKGSKNIIAINTDINSPIFKIAHQPICGDLYEILPRLIKKIKSGSGKD